MPYINQDRRDNLQEALESLVTELTCLDGGCVPGDLNYSISYIIMETLLGLGKTNYSNINDAIGMLECVKQELYRRIAAPYEDIKAKENGDVF